MGGAIADGSGRGGAGHGSCGCGLGWALGCASFLDASADIPLRGGSARQFFTRISRNQTQKILFRDAWGWSLLRSQRCCAWNWLLEPSGPSQLGSYRLVSIMDQEWTEATSSVMNR